MARSRLMRPLPGPSFASVLRASRPMIVAFDAPSFARMSAAAPATIADEADVPVIDETPSLPDAAMSTPGADTKTALLWLLPDHIASDRSVAPTPTTLARPAG